MAQQVKSSFHVLASLFVPLSPPQGFLPHTTDAKVLIMYILWAGSWESSRYKYEREAVPVWKSPASTTAISSRLQAGLIPEAQQPSECTVHQVQLLSAECCLLALGIMGHRQLSSNTPGVCRSKLQKQPSSKCFTNNHATQRTEACSGGPGSIKTAGQL